MVDTAKSTMTKGIYSYYLGYQTKSNQLCKYHANLESSLELVSLIIVIQESSNLKRVLLHENCITLKDGRLVDIITSEPQLLTTVQYNSKISTEGMRFMADTRKLNPLTIISGRNQGNKQHGRHQRRLHYGCALKVNDTLLGMNLSGDRIGTEGKRLLVDALGTNQTLLW